METEELRLKIYERLGLEIGSLKSESGNDWVRAEKEILEEYRNTIFEKLNELSSIDYLNIDKDSDEYCLVINSNSLLLQNSKVIIAKRDDLDKVDINKLILDGNKDILINLTKYQKLSSDEIDLIIPKSTYLVKNNLIENQILTSEQKEKLVSLMKESSLDYSELLNKLVTVI